LPFFLADAQLVVRRFSSKRASTARAALGEIAVFAAFAGRADEIARRAVYIR
jgi:hypothetical protein